MTETFCDRCQVKVDIPGHRFYYLEAGEHEIIVTTRGKDYCQGCIITIISETIPGTTKGG